MAEHPIQDPQAELDLFAFETEGSKNMLIINLMACFARQSIKWKEGTDCNYECDALHYSNFVSFKIYIYEDEYKQFVEITCLTGYLLAFSELVKKIVQDMDVKLSYGTFLRLPPSKIPDFSDESLKRFAEISMKTENSWFILSKFSEFGDALEIMSDSSESKSTFEKCFGPGGYWIKIVVRLSELAETQDPIIMSCLAEVARAVAATTVVVDPIILKSLRICFQYINIKTPYHARREAVKIAAYLCKNHKNLVKKHLKVKKVQKVVFKADGLPNGNERDDTTLFFADEIMDRLSRT